MQVKHTKAAILVGLNEPLAVEEIELPDSLDFGQVLVELHYSGICGSQLNEIAGAKGVDEFLPHLQGHEGAGVVLEIGPGVKTVSVDDHVVMHWRQGDGLEAETPSYRWGDCRVNAGRVTTFNQHAIISENRLTPIPRDFDMSLAPLFGCGVTTAAGVINNDARVKIGQAVVIFGMGGLGLNLAQAAHMVSAHPIIGIDIKAQKLNLARRFHTTHCFDSSETDDLDGEIRGLVGEKGADVVIDTTGRPPVIERAYQLTHPDGKTILVGVPGKGENINIYSLPLHFGKVLTGSHGGSAEPHLDIPRYIRLCRAGKMSLDGLITHEFRLEQVNEALDLVRSGEAGRCVLSMV